MGKDFDQEAKVFKAFCDPNRLKILDILKDGECGILFEIGNEKELADNIEKILKNQELKKEYEKLIKERVKEFDSKNVMKEYEKLIEEI